MDGWKWVQGAVVATLLVAVYFTVWQTARTAWVEHVAYPAFKRVASTATGSSVARPRARAVSFQMGSPDRASTAWTNTPSVGQRPAAK